MQTNNEVSLIETPMLIIRNNPPLPHALSSFIIGRETTKNSLEKALQTDKQVFIVMQKNSDTEEPTRKDLYQIGMFGKIFQTIRLPNNMIKTIFQAESRAKWHYLDMQKEQYTSFIELIQEKEIVSKEASVLFEQTLAILSEEIQQEKAIKEILADKNTVNLSKLADSLIPLLTLSDTQQQILLEELDPYVRLEKIYFELAKNLEYKKIEQSLKEKVQEQLSKTQKEYYLNEQLKVIHKELGHEDGVDEFTRLQTKIKESNISEKAKLIALKESLKLRSAQQTSAEANIVRTYIEKLLSLPWNHDEKVKNRISISKAEKILNQDHFGLEKIKTRILEHIAVAKHVKKSKPTILCFIGPPGVGKTSFCQSIAKTLHRDFIRISLGGVHDEAEIRGHRRTYLGAMPGKIIQAISRMKSNNPVILLDEIDKMTQSAMGNPAAALLEVLDPSQNSTFVDHYIEVEYDLSNIMFLCTANNINDIPYALCDRLEIISLAGYTVYEKMKISKQYLLPNLCKEYNIKQEDLHLQKAALLQIIEEYTHEAGVRKLEQLLSSICRKVVMSKLKKEENKETITYIDITKENINEFLGAPTYHITNLLQQQEIGIASGLAWTQTGGEVLLIEVNYMHGNGQIHMTGKLGDVMKESAQTALSYVRTNADSLKLAHIQFNLIDIHIHIPSGAIPKDGPSAGVSMSMALISALLKEPLYQTVALTGEVTLYGHVRAIGGLREKLLAAQRYGIKTVLLPKQNEQDIEEIHKDIIENLQIFFVSNVNEILPYIFVNAESLGFTKK